MKKAAILSTAAFYLLLTSGMFVCMVHCGAESLFGKAETNKSCIAMRGHKRSCCNDRGHDCCKHHSNYTVKENIKTGFQLQFTQTAIAIDRPLIGYNSGYISKAKDISWLPAKAPPRPSGKLIAIQNNSLQI